MIRPGYRRGRCRGEPVYAGPSQYKGTAVSLAWTDVTFAYAIYLAAIAWAVPRFAVARLTATLALAILLGLWLWWPSSGDGTLIGAAVRWVVVPSLALLVTYRASGAFFVRPSPPLERWLLAIDDALLWRTGILRVFGAGSTLVRDVFELFYLLVYAVVPAGAVVLLASGRHDALGLYWTTLFVAELTCYAALPWLQSRPPRAVEAEAASGTSARNLNLWLLRYGSIQCNTFPSAHAAGAVAIGLAVSSAFPSAGVVFMVVAAGITMATVLGRYHYLLDSVLGVVVATISWAVLRA